MRIATTLSVMLLLLGGCATALEWTELSALATATTGSSGEPAVIFSVQLEYDARPREADLSFGWTVEERADGETAVIDTFYRSTGFPGGALRISFASDRIPIKAGTLYRAHVIVDDAANDLHYERDIDYTAPVSLPVGIHLRGTNETEEWDLSGVPDEELEEMATAYDALLSEYTEEANDVRIDAFFADHASTTDAFPVTVFVIPAVGDESPFGPSDSPVTFSIVPMLYVFPVPEQNGVPGLLEQLSIYQREFIGRVFVGGPDDGVFGAVTVYVDEEAWMVLAAAKAEEDRRASR